MFEDALLESSPRRAAVLCRTHYLFSALAGTLFFVLGWRLLPLLMATAGARALLAASATAGFMGAAGTLMLCYVWADARRRNLGPWPWIGVTLLLNLPGFLAYLVYSAWKTGDWKRAAIPLAYATETVFVGLLLLVPLICTEALPKQLLWSERSIPLPPGRPVVRPVGDRALNPARRPKADVFTAPAEIPHGITRIVEAPEPVSRIAESGSEVLGAVPGGSYGGGLGTFLDGLPGNNTPPPPPRPAAPRRQLYRVGGDVIAARAVYQPKPSYPAIAIMAHVQGTVVLRAIIGKDGTVLNLTVLRGHPLLVHAALDAVKTWRYQPTLLNSEPVEVLTEIDVNFRLGE